MSSEALFTTASTSFFWGHVWMGHYSAGMYGREGGPCVCLCPFPAKVERKSDVCMHCEIFQNPASNVNRAPEALLRICLDLQDRHESVMQQFKYILVLNLHITTVQANHAALTACEVVSGQAEVCLELAACCSVCITLRAPSSMWWLEVIICFTIWHRLERRNTQAPHHSQHGKGNE
jgi:hypothetical protein